MRSGPFNCWRGSIPNRSCCGLRGSGAEGSRTSHSLSRSPAERASRHSWRRLLPLVGDKDSMVRLQLAFSLGAANTDPRVMAALASIATSDATSNWTRTAVLSSIGGHSLAFLGELGVQNGLLLSRCWSAMARRACVLRWIGARSGPVEPTARRVGQCECWTRNP